MWLGSALRRPQTGACSTTLGAAKRGSQPQTCSLTAPGFVLKPHPACRRGLQVFGLLPNPVAIAVVQKPDSTGTSPVGRVLKQSLVL